MEKSTILLDCCKIISENLKANLCNYNIVINEIDLSKYNDLFLSIEGSEFYKNIHLNYISIIYSDSFYHDSQFVYIFSRLINHIDDNDDISNDCKLNLSLLLLVSFLLNYKTAKFVFESYPDIALSLSIRILESFFDDDHFTIEKILLSYRLKNDFRIGRFCSRLLRQAKYRKNYYSVINELLCINDYTQINTIKHRLIILSNLSDVLDLINLRYLILYSKSDSRVGLNQFDIDLIDKFIENDEFKEVCELSQSILNNKHTQPIYSINSITVSFKNVRIDKRVTPNLIQTQNHVSYIRDTKLFRSHDNRDDGDNYLNHNHLQLKREDYVVLSFSEQVISNLLFTIDCSLAVIVCGECKNYYLRLLANRLGIDTTKINNVYTDETTDIKSLIGNWVSTDTLGEFKFNYGVLSRAMVEGRWLIFDSYMSDSIFAFLIDVCKSGYLFINELNEKIYAHENFQLFIIPYTNTNSINNSSLTSASNKLTIDIDYLYGSLLSNEQVPIVYIQSADKHEILKICESLYPHHYVTQVILNVYTLSDSFKDDLNISINKLIRLIRRIYPYLTAISKSGNNRNNYVSEDTIKLIMFDFYNIFVSSIFCETTRTNIMMKLASIFNIHLDNISDIYSSFKSLEPILPNILNTLTSNQSSQDSNFNTHTSDNELEFERNIFQCINKFDFHNYHVLRMIYSSFVRNEPVLLVGETGTGKTAIVQKFAEITGNTLKVFVFSENSDSSDLIGSYYPVADFVEKHDDVSDYNTQNDNSNSKSIKFKFVEGILIDCLRNGHWLLLDEINLAQQDLLYKIYSILHQVYQNNNTITASDNLQNNTYQQNKMELYEYMDSEILIHKNFRLFSCMNPPMIKKNNGFTFNTGKKDLPASFAKVFTTIYVDPINSFDSLFKVAYYHCRNVTRNLNLRELCSFYLNIVDLVDNCEIEDGSFKVPNFTLRNFVRAVQYIVTLSTREFNPVTDLNKLLYDSISANFLSTLGHNSIKKVLDILPSSILDYAKADLNITESNSKPSFFSKGSRSEDYCSHEYSSCRKYINIYGYWVKLGESKSPEDISTIINKVNEVISNSSNYVLCKNNVGYLIKLVRILSGSRVPILLQGPTAAGKTSLIKYLCKLTNHMCVRINNHEHTDISEYIGQHHFQGGKMVFEYGTLVVAMKYGYWVILDELNLASSEILECLNRILDDNREIYISETNETIKCHEDFMIFATQNPSDSIYGGRKQLSRSFTNRFIQLFFDDISNDDLKLILHKRCDIPLSKSEIIVDLYHKIRNVTINSILFQKNQILITTRDLIKLSYRIKDNFSKEQILIYYYSLIAEKLYNDKEKQIILNILNSYFFSEKNKTLDNDYDDHTGKRRKINQYFTVGDVELEYVEMLMNNTQLDLELLKIFFIENDYYWIEGYTDRIVYLLITAINNRENVLLIGETGIGKTTIVQLLSRFMNLHLNIFNCNLNTEASDFIGSICPANDNMMKSNISNYQLDNHTNNPESSNNQLNTQDQLFKWVDGPLIYSMMNGEWFLLDEISLTEDSVLEKINSVLEFESYLVLNQTFSTKSSSTDNDMTNDKTNYNNDVIPTEQIRTIYSHSNFRLFGTMNPGNDFGKKELSPSLSNRFTQIYVPPIPLNDLKILRNIIQYHNQNTLLEDWFVNSTKDIVELLLEFKNNNENYITIRNLIIWSNYYFKALDSYLNQIGLRNPDNKQLITQKVKIYIEGLHLSILNSYKNNPIDIQLVCNIVNKYLHFDNSSLQSECVQFKIGYMLMKSYQHLNHISVLLEGNPGVGKTYGVYQLAQKLGKKLIRVNLNEYTDMSDLLGTYVPSFNSIQHSNETHNDSVNNSTIIYQNTGHHNYDRSIKNNNNLFHDLNNKYDPFNTIQNQNGIKYSDNIMNGFNINGGDFSSYYKTKFKTSDVKFQNNTSDNGYFNHLDVYPNRIKSIDTYSGISLDRDNENHRIVKRNSSTSNGIRNGFKWVNGPLLECMINGYWLLLDELNLASSEILEGLNSVLDHRRDLFVPQLNMNINCHKEFRIFATQNSVSNTNYRKHLPRSFLNRFIILYVPDLNFNDYYNIIFSMFPNTSTMINKYVDFITKSSSPTFINKFNPRNVSTNGLWNIRDLINIFRFIIYYDETNAINIVLLNRMTYFNKYVNNYNDSDSFVYKYVKSLLNYDIDNGYPIHIYNHMSSINDNHKDLYNTNSIIQSVDTSFDHLFYLDYVQVYDQLISIHPLKLPILIIYNDNHLNYGSNLVNTFHKLIVLNSSNALLRSSTVKSVKLYNNSDINDLIGSYEQINDQYFLNHLYELYDKLKNFVSTNYPYIYHKFTLYNTSKKGINEIDTITKFIKHVSQNLRHIKSQYHHKVNSMITQIKALLFNHNTNNYSSLNKSDRNINFKWVDSDIINAIESGDWLLINDIHLVSSSLLDRLNSLLEPRRDMNVNECGYNRYIDVNENFRIFFTVHQDHINNLSNSFLNRCIQINLNTSMLLNRSKSILISSIFEPFIKETRIMLKDSRFSFQMYQFYNLLNFVLNTAYHSTFDQNHLQDIIHICLLFLFIKDIFNVKMILLHYLIRFYQGCHDLLSSFNNAWSIYSINNHDSNIGVVDICNRFIQYLTHLTYSNNYLYFILKDFIQVVLSNKYRVDERLIMNDIELKNIYHKYYSNTQIADLWNLQKGMRFIKNYRLSNLFGSNENTLSKVYYYLNSNDIEIDVNVLKLYLVLLNPNELLQNIINDNVQLIMNTDYEFINVLHFVHCVSSYYEHPIHSINDINISVDNISLGRLYVIYKSLKGYKYTIKPEHSVKFDIVNKYNISVDQHPLNFIVVDSKLLENNEENGNYQILLEKFILKRVMFLINRLYHDFFVYGDINSLIIEYFNELMTLIDNYYPNINVFFKETLTNIILSIVSFNKTNSICHLNEILYLVYILYNNYHNSPNNVDVNIVSYLNDFLFPQSPVDHSNTNHPMYNENDSLYNELFEHEWDLIYYLIKMDTFNDLMNLEDNIKKLKMIEYLTKFSNSLCYYTFLFMHLVYNVGYMKYHMSLFGLNVDLIGFIKLTYRKIAGESDDIKLNNDLNKDVDYIRSFLYANTQLDNGAILSIVYNILSILISIYDTYDRKGKSSHSHFLISLHTNLMTYSLMILPHVNDFLGDLEMYYNDNFIEYEKNQFVNVYESFNILDSLSLGYSLNNKYLLDYIEILKTNAQSLNDKQLHNQPNNVYELIIDFISDYDRFKNDYLNVSNSNNQNNTFSEFVSNNQLILGEKNKTLDAIRNFISHITTKYKSINKVIQHPIIMLHSILFHYHFTEYIGKYSCRQDRIRWENYININVINAKINPILKMLFSNLKDQNIEFNKVFQLYLLYLAHNQRNYFTYMPLTSDRHKKNILSILVNHIRLYEVPKDNYNIQKIEFKLNNIQKQLLSSIEEYIDNPNVNVQTNRQFEYKVFLDNDDIVKYLLNNTNLSVEHEFEIQRLYIMASLFTVFSIKCHSDINFNDIIQSAFFYKYVKSYKFDDLIFHYDYTLDTDDQKLMFDSRLDTSTNENRLLIRSRRTLIELQNQMTNFLSIYENDHIVQDIKSFVSTILNFNIYKLNENYKISNLLMNLNNKLNHLSSIINIQYSDTMKVYIQRINEIVDNYKVLKKTQLSTFYQVILENYKVSLFNNLYIKIISMLSKFIDVMDINESEKIPHDSVPTLIEARNHLMNILFNSNIINVLILKSVLRNITLTMPDCTQVTTLCEFFEYLILFFKDYETVVSNYVEQLNKNYIDNVKEFTNIKELNYKKIISKYKEGLNVNFIHLYYSRVLQFKSPILTNYEMMGHLVLMVKTNYVYILNHSEEMKFNEYNRIISSIIKHLQNMDLFNSTNIDSIPIKTRSRTSILNSKLIVLNLEKSEDDINHDAFGPFYNYINTSLGYLFKSLNTMYNVTNVTSMKNPSQLYNLDLFNKIVKQDTINLVNKILDVILGRVVDAFYGFNYFVKFDLLLRSRQSNFRTVIEFKFTNILIAVNDLLMIVRQYVSSGNYSFYLDYEDIDSALSNKNKIYEHSQLYSICNKIEKHVKQSMEYSVYDSSNKKEIQRKKTVVSAEWADTLMFYVSQIESIIYKLVNNILITNTKKIINKLKLELLLLVTNQPYGQEYNNVNKKWKLDESFVMVNEYSIMELCVFGYYLSKLIELFIYIKPKVKEEETDHHNDYNAGTGFDEGVGIKNVSDEVKEDELNMDNCTKQELKQEENEFNLDEDKNINFDFNEEYVKLDLEEVNDDELENKDEDVMNNIEDDYTSNRDDKNINDKLETEEVDLNHDYDQLDDMKTNQEFTDSNEQSDQLDGFNDDEFDKGNDRENANNQNKTDQEPLLNDDEDLMNEADPEIENEQMDDIDDYHSVEDANSIENKDFNESDVNDEQLENEESNELKSKSDRTKSYNDCAYGLNYKGYDNIINELEQFNLNNEFQSSSYTNDMSNAQSTRVDNSHLINDYEIETNELNDYPQSINEDIDKNKLIKHDTFNNPIDKSQLFEYFNSRANQGSLQGLGEYSHQINTEIDGLHNESKPKIDEQNIEHNESNDNKNGFDRIDDNKNDELKMDGDADKQFDSEHNQDRIVINNDMLYDIRPQDLDYIDFVLNTCVDDSKSIDVDSIFDKNSLIQLSNDLLCQLRIILEYNYVNSLKGYYKHGKRISIKKLMLFIATNYQKDKIWLKRLKPQKRDYFIQIAIDNTKSMNTISKISIQTIIIIYEAIHKLNVGTLNIIKFGAYVPEIILNNSTMKYNNSWMNKLSFDEESKNSYENGLIQLFQFILTQTHFIASKNKILIIISDGKFNKNKVRKYLINIINHNVVPLLIVLDPQNSITNMKHITNTDGRIVIENYLDNFPFPYYSIINNINHLPNILSDLLKQWMMICNKY